MFVTLGLIFLVLGVSHVIATFSHPHEKTELKELVTLCSGMVLALSCVAVFIFATEPGAERTIWLTNGVSLTIHHKVYDYLVVFFSLYGNFRLFLHVIFTLDVYMTKDNILSLINAQIFLNALINWEQIFICFLMVFFHY